MIGREEPVLSIFNLSQIDTFTTYTKNEFLEK